MPNRSLDDTLKEFCDYLLVRHSENTVYAYESDLTKFASFLSGRFSVDSWQDVKPRHIDLYITSLSGMQHSTLSRKVASISSLYRYLIRQGEVLENPSRDVEPIKISRRAPDFLEKEEIKVVRAVSEKKSLLMLVIVELLISTGMRVSELCNANKGDFDTKKLSMVVIGKGDKQRIVYMSKRAAVAIKKYLKTREDNSPALLFLNGKRMTRFQVYRFVRMIGKRYLGRNLHPHLFRHTLATHASLGGMPLQELQSLLGHATINTTMIYTHPSKEIQAHHAKVIESMEVGKREEGEQ